MKIVDFHTHTFPDELAPKAVSLLLSSAPGTQAWTDGTLGGLRRSMATSGIAYSVTLPVATKVAQVPTINRAAAQLRVDGVIPFGALHPQQGDLDEEIQFLKGSGVPGIKLHPEYQDFYVDDPALFPLYERVSDAGLVLVFHAGHDPGPFTCDHCLPAALRRVIDEFPELLVVAAHMGGWKVWDDVEEQLCGRDIYFDTSAVSGLLPVPQFRRMLEKHGSDHVLYGSDSPWFDQTEMLRWVEQSGLDASGIEKILSHNALRLIGERQGGVPT